MENIDLEFENLDFEIKFKNSQGLDRDKLLKMIMESEILDIDNLNFEFENHDLDFGNLEFDLESIDFEFENRDFEIKFKNRQGLDPETPLKLILESSFWTLTTSILHLKIAILTLNLRIPRGWILRNP